MKYLVVKQFDNFLQNDKVLYISVACHYVVSNRFYDE